MSSAPFALHVAERAGNVAQIAEDIGILHDDAGGVGVDPVGEIFLGENIGRQAHDLVARHARNGAHDLGVMRVQTAREHGLAAPGDAMGHQHRLDRRGRAVIHRGVGDIHAGQRRDLGLELENRL